MIKLFSRSPKPGFRTRSLHRDVEDDRKIFEQIETAIETAMAGLHAQKDGLTLRVEDALTRASITVGNDTYEHDTRDGVRTEALKGFEKQLASARERLTVVDGHIANLKFVRAAFLTRFPKTDK